MRRLRSSLFDGRSLRVAQQRPLRVAQERRTNTTEAINQVEQVLRSLILRQLGENWKATAGVDVSKLQEKRDTDAKRRFGAVPSQQLIDYLEFYELKEIIHKNWVHFKPALPQKSRFDAYLDSLEGWRNPAMHSRDLLPHEEHMVLGITGLIRNSIAIYRSSKGPDLNYYPVIEAVIDSFGRRQVEGRLPLNVPKIRVCVGDTVTFDCRADDPQGREIYWALYRGDFKAEAVRATGASAILVWEVTEDDVRERLNVCITMKGEGKFHRHGNDDSSVNLEYDVLPPDA